MYFIFKENMAQVAFGFDGQTLYAGWPYCSGLLQNVKLNFRLD